MTRHITPARAVVVLGVALLVAPALFPVQPLAYHDTRPGTHDNATMLEEQGFTIVAYENLSDRGQELYVSTLENDGRYGVAVDSGATDFPYPTNGELGDIQDFESRNAIQSVVIERPANASLPPADEPVRRAPEIAARSTENPERPNRTEAEVRQQIERYDVMQTRTGTPDLTATSSLLRLLSAAIGIVAIGTGGYFGSKP